MKKYFFTALVAAAAISGAFGYFNQPTQHELNALALANVEALTTIEYDEFCQDYCHNKYGYICYLEMNYGFNIYCDDMVDWTFIGR